MQLKAYLFKLCLCGKLGGGRFDDCLDGKGAYREPRAKNTRALMLFHL